MRKPTVAAWVANLVARSLPDDLDDLLALGDEFREATADLDGDRLRDLTPKRHQLLDKLSKEAVRLAGDEGQKVSADVGQKLRETLDAALIDPAAGDALREGRLSSALRHVGFGVVDENGEPSNVTPLTDERRQAARDRRKTQQAEADKESASARSKREAAEREEEEREAAEKAKAKTGVRGRGHRSPGGRGKGRGPRQPARRRPRGPGRRPGAGQATRRRAGRCPSSGPRRPETQPRGTQAIQPALSWVPATLVRGLWGLLPASGGGSCWGWRGRRRRASG